MPQDWVMPKGFLKTEDGVTYIFDGTVWFPFYSEMGQIVLEQVKEQFRKEGLRSTKGSED